MASNRGIIVQGAWPKDKNLKYMGAVATECLQTGLEAYAIYVFTKHGYSVEESKKLIDGAFSDIKSRKVHG